MSEIETWLRELFTAKDERDAAVHEARVAEYHMRKYKKRLGEVRERELMTDDVTKLRHELNRVRLEFRRYVNYTPPNVRQNYLVRRDADSFGEFIGEATGEES